MNETLLSPADRDQIRSKYLDGASLRVLATEYQVSRTTISRVVSDLPNRYERAKSGRQAAESGTAPQENGTAPMVQVDGTALVQHRTLSDLYQ